MQNLIGFFHGVSEEMKKVRWPHKKELTKYTITVLVTVIFFALFFTVVDLGITQLINLIP